MRWAVFLLVLGVGGALRAAHATPAPAPLPSLTSGHFMDGPPVRSTGGFGEPSCLDCHWGEEENDPGGRFWIEGLPDRFEPGDSYTLTVGLARPGLAVGGFQLAARFAPGGEQAGTLSIPPSESNRISVVEERGVMYAQQLLAGIAPTRPDTVLWTVEWTAPSAAGLVLFHASGNVGDGDDSQIGDFVYTLEEATDGTPGEA